MSRQKTPKQQSRELVLLPVEGEWPFGGYLFAGGRVELGGNVGKLSDWRYGQNVSPSKFVAMGTLFMSSVGYSDPEIGSALHYSPGYIRNVINGLRAAANVPQRHMLLPGALNEGILRIESYGEPGKDFRVNPYRLGQLGLLARGVDRAYIAEACNIHKLGLGAVMSQLAAHEGVKKTAGCIAAALITQQLEIQSCVPLQHLGDGSGYVEPMVPRDAWNELVETADKEAFIEKFKLLGLQRIPT